MVDPDKVEKILVSHRLGEILNTGVLNQSHYTTAKAGARKPRSQRARFTGNLDQTVQFRAADLEILGTASMGFVHQFANPRNFALLQSPSRSFDTLCLRDDMPASFLKRKALSRLRENSAVLQSQEFGLNFPD